MDKKIAEMADRMRAQLALGEEPRFRWLCDRSVMEGGRPKSWRPELLGELGRLHKEQGREKMLHLAQELCELQPETMEGLEMVRQQRRGPLSAEAAELAAALIEKAEELLEGRPLEDEQIARALEEVASRLIPS